MTHRILRPKCEAHYFSLSAGIQIVKTGFQGGCTSCSQNLQGNNPWNVKQKKMKRNKENDFSNILIQNWQINLISKARNRTHALNLNPRVFFYCLGDDHAIRPFNFGHIIQFFHLRKEISAVTRPHYNKKINFTK